VADALLLGLARVGKIGVRVDLATSTPNGSAEGWATGDRLGVREPPREGLWCLVRDGFGLGPADGVDDAGPGDETAGAGIVVVGAGAGAGVVGATDGDGTAEEPVGDGAAESVGGAGVADTPDVGSAEVGATLVESGCTPNPDVDPGPVTVAAAATPAPDEQAMAAVAPAVTAPRTTRARRFAPRALLKAPELALSGLPAASADIRPPCLDHRTLPI